MKGKRLDPLLDRARQREDAARRELAERMGQLRRQEDRLQELSRYAEEYACGAGDMTDPATLMNRIAFRERIDEALSRQVRVVEHIRENCDLERTRLLLAGRDKAVLEKLAASYRQETMQQERRQEQGRTDDLAMLGHRRRQEQGTQSP